MDNLNKKAVVFTFIVVVLLAIILIAFLVNLGYRETQSKIHSTNVKVETLNSFVRSLNSSYLPNALKISSHQAMLSLLDYESNNTYVDINNYLKQVLTTGYYNGVRQPDMFQNRLDYTLPYTLNEIRGLAQQQGTILDYSKVDFSTLTIKQNNPWQLITSLRLSYYVNDTNNEVFWNIDNREIFAILNINEYRDPIYLVEKEPGTSIVITKVPYDLTYFSDLNNFNTHVEKANFTNNPAAPSFIQRLNGDFKKPGFVPDGKGIESLIDPSTESNPSGYSNADYQFYTFVIGLCVKDMPSNFNLDQAHINYYGRSNC